MPAGFVPNQALPVQLEESLGKRAPSVLPWELIFFVNDIVPPPSVVVYDLVEATWGGYVPATLSRSGWTTPTVVAGCAHSTWGEQPIVWTVTGSLVQTNYGYAYLDRAAGVLRFIQRFDDEDIQPIIIGGTVSLLPEFTAKSAEC